jgi:hypothetical protein
MDQHRENLYNAPLPQGLLMPFKPSISALQLDGVSDSRKIKRRIVTTRPKSARRGNKEFAYFTIKNRLCKLNLDASMARAVNRRQRGLPKGSSELNKG